MAAAVKFPLADFQSAPVCSLAHVWKTSCASGLFCGNILSVLHHSYCLKVIGFVKRTVDCPVVRYGNPLPAFCGLDVVSFAELPVFQYVFASLGLAGSGQSHGHYHQHGQNMFHLVSSHFVNLTNVANF